MRDVTQLAGRHATPVDQAEAILWHGHIRYCVQLLIDTMDDCPELQPDRIPAEIRDWMLAARKVLKDVISYG
jgi:hypothetical protein